MKGRLTAAVLLPVLLLACHGTPAPATPSPPAVQTTDPVGALRERIAQLLDDPSVSMGTWGVEARSLRDGRTLVDLNAHRLLTPASTLKTVTLAVAADQLGWDYTYQTRVVPTGDVENGTLNGDLVIIGSGDPSLDDWDKSASVVFRTWADRLRELGITRIAGRIVGDDHVFSDEGFGSGWMWDDMAASYSAPASGLQFNEGAAQVVITPGPAAGAPATLALVPPYANVLLRGGVLTERAGGPTAISTQASGRTAAIGIGGTIALDIGKQVRTIAVGNPTQYFVNAVRASLLANGIDVQGPAVDADDIPDAPLVNTQAAMLVHRSPTLASLADTLMKLSQNLYAESFLRTLGHARSGKGTADAGRAVLRDVLASWDVPTSEMVIADGSGLSRYNMVTAHALVAVLAHVYGDARLRDVYIGTLPVAGRAGTLSARMNGTVAEGQVHAKTGSFTNARSVAGFAQSADGEPLAFAIVANNYGVAPAEVDRVTDAVIVALAQFRRP